MSATDELRRLLDERGVEWAEGIARPELTQVRIDGKVAKFHPWQPNTLKVSLFDITPEQAVAATLGRGTCELVNAAEDLGDGTSSCMCYECGYTALDDWWDEFKYCPNCGRKVVTNG